MSKLTHAAAVGHFRHMFIRISVAINLL